MRLFIAEKPDLAKAIVEGLGGGTRRNGYYECGSDYVAWCYGHMLQLLDPEDYDEKFAKWSLDDLPFAHIPWKKKPSGDEGAQAQLNTILELLKRADSVVNAGDPDEEGQLLVDEILEYAGCSLPVKRVLINDNNTKVVRKALESMRDNSEFAGDSAAAEARSVGDQLYGYNLTRAYTLCAQAKGYQGVLSVGRVQTAVLGLVVRRTREFKAHQKAYYYNVVGQFDVGGVSFPARYQVIDSDPVDEKGRLTEQGHAEGIAGAVKGQPAKILSNVTKQKEKKAPLPYNLLKLQADASRKYGLKPDQVKDITQSLREKHRLITYNRSDCRYLSDEQHADAPNVLAAIGQTAPALAPAVQRANPSIKGRAFNSAKVSAHHGIIPTEATANLAALSDAEQKIYLLIARAYIAQFWPNQEYDHTVTQVEVEGHRFAVGSKVTTKPGWLALYRNDAGNEETEDEEGDGDSLEIDIRTLRDGQAGTCTGAEAEKEETKPKPLYTMDTLLGDLTRVAKYIRNEKLRKLLLEKDKGKEGENGGIGTPATRDSIIATLFERGYFAEQGRSIICTPTAEELYDALPDQAKYPDMTAIWHEQQNTIKAGKRDAESFVRELMEYISKEVGNLKTNGLQIKVSAKACPKCKVGFLRRFPRQAGGFFWSCTRYQEGCDASYDDKGGVPVPRAPVVVSKVHKCKSCGKGLIRREGVKRPGKPALPWWSCSGYPDCSEKYPDLKGQPNFSK